jgi:pyrimidine deaminase RibD-like protein
MRLDDHEIMLRALAISKKALPHCLPNPPVGCVLAKDGRIVAEGYTQPIGGNHAEVEEIRKYSGKLENIVAYVTLEPCAFVGRTPSCASMLGSSKLSKVLVAITDPDPRNDGKGIQILKNEGVKVEVGLAANEVADFLTQYIGKS